MRFFISVLLIALASFAACLFLPWWMTAVIAFIVVIFIPQKPGLAFLSGFLAVSLLWGIMSLMISLANEHVLAHRVSLLILKMDNPVLLIVATALTGGLVAGFAALAASFSRRVVKAEVQV